MRLQVAVGLVALALAACRSDAQYQPPSEKLSLSGATALTWSNGRTDIVQIEGPLTIELDRATLTGSRAVLWLTPARDESPGVKHAEIALIGQAKLQQGDSVRSGDQLFVTVDVRGPIRLTADERIEKNNTDSPAYRAADVMRVKNQRALAEVAAQAATEPGPATAPAPPAVTATAPAPAPPPPASEPSAGTPLPLPATQRARASRGAIRAPAAASTQSADLPVIFEAPQIETVQTDEGTVAVILSKGVKLFQHRPNNDLIELQADRAVLFTPLKSLRDIGRSQQIHAIQDAIKAAYLEGDVHVVFTPGDAKQSEQRLQAASVYYEFSADRAILTQAVLHTLDPQKGLPLVMRANTIRQLAVGEYKAQGVKLTTSSFALPSYGIYADRIYIRTAEGPGPHEKDEVAYFKANDATFRAFGVPAFYLPSVSGSLTEGGGALRGIGFGDGHAFGFEALTEWGLFETLGKAPPKDLDVSYRLDYLSERGPAGGIDAAYGGGFITDTTRQPWDFTGDFHSYFVYDKGTDDLGRTTPRTSSDPTFRGHLLFEHEHYFPDGWQAQVRAGYVTDANFLEQWFRPEFEQELPHDVSAYIKHQDQTEAFTLLVQAQPNGLVTTSDMIQEQFEVEHLPEVSYRRIGDSFAEDNLTFFSENVASGLHFKRSRASLADQGYRSPDLLPGIAAEGQTGLTNSITWRGDFRQEVDYPISAGPFRVVPYGIGRYTEYSNSPGRGSQDRFYGGAGARVITDLWRVYPNVSSDLFDLHTLRHVIEPEVNVYTSGQTVDRSHLYDYEEQVDAINDISAAQFALHQRFQTKRGAPGLTRSVDFLTLNVEADYFQNKPSRQLLNPYQFRGLFFPSLPEASAPRDSIAADAAWRISDSTVILADTDWNIDKKQLATLAVGILVQRDQRLSYYIGNRYIAALNSNITSVEVSYEMSPKYQLDFSQQFDFSQGQNVATSVQVIRKFDRFFISVQYSHDETTNQSGFGFNITPMGFGYALDSNQISNGPFRR